jgi:Flp pilus assembly pilin Flp
MFAYSFALLERVKADRKGVTALEYGVIAAGIVVVVSAAAIALGTRLSNLFGTFISS